MDLVLDALLQKHGFDFRGYARKSMRRRLVALAGCLGASGMSGLAGRILEDDTLLPRVLAGISVSVTDMFRDPLAYKALRPRLRGLAERRGGRLSLWQAGCATGEESFSLLITLAEEGLLEGSSLLATDINGDALRQAMSGCLPARRMASAVRAHKECGGASLPRWFLPHDGAHRLIPELLGHVAWRQLNLVGDSYPDELDVIVCRNVLTYFDLPLCERVVRAFALRLRPGGLLWIGQKESLSFIKAATHLKRIPCAASLYEKM